MNPEETLLRDEAEQARLAIVRTLASMKSGLNDATDPQAWARAHPWVSVGVAAAAGFAAAAAAVPARGEHVVDKWGRLVERFAPRGPQAPAQEAVHAAADHASRAYTAATTSPHTAPTSLWDAVFELAKVAVTNIVIMLVQRPATPSTPPAAAASTNDEAASAPASEPVSEYETNGRHQYASDTPL